MKRESLRQIGNPDQFRLNLVIVGGLILIAIVILGLLAVMHRTGQQLPGELIAVLSGIVGGLVAFLSHPGNQSSLSAPNAENLTVNQNPEIPPTNTQTTSPKNNGIEDLNNGS